jgi:hypothetical protein
MGSRQPDWSAKPVLPLGTRAFESLALRQFSNYLIFDNLLSLGSWPSGKGSRL